MEGKGQSNETCPHSRIGFISSTRIFSIICRPASTQPSRCDRVTEKAFAAGRTPFKIALAHKATLNAALGFVHDHLRRRFAHLQLRANSLDLRGLLLDRCRETRNRTF